MLTIQDFTPIEGLVILENEPLARHTTFAIGGPARLFIIPQTVAAFGAAYALCKREKKTVLGNGSNLLCSDKGYDGICFCLKDGLCGVSRSGTVLTAGGGLLLSRLAAFAREEGLAGVATVGGIPGTVGGAVFMNAGAYGGEIKDCLLSATFMDENGTISTLPAEKLALSYRHSIFKDRRGLVILSAEFGLTEGDPREIAAAMTDFNGRRREKQPLEYPSAGSTFQRPEGHFAGVLIEAAGLKGFSIGGAQVSKKHAGFVVNRGGATCDDVLRLIEHIQKVVFAHSGVALTPEVEFLRP